MTSTKCNCGSAHTSDTALRIFTLPKSDILADNAQWQNRFQVRSQSSGNVYIIAQRKTSHSWGCSCRGWIRWRNCKHLKACGIPCFEQPYELKLQGK